MITSSPGSTPERAERQLDRVRARGDADRLLRAAVRGEGLLERLDAGTADEAVAADDGGDRLVQLLPQGGVLAAEVEERDGHASDQYRSPCSR